VPSQQFRIIWVAPLSSFTPPASRTQSVPGSLRAENAAPRERRRVRTAAAPRRHVTGIGYIVWRVNPRLPPNRRRRGWGRRTPPLRLESILSRLSGVLRAFSFRGSHIIVSSQRPTSSAKQASRRYYPLRTVLIPGVLRIKLSSNRSLVSAPRVGAPPRHRNRRPRRAASQCTRFSATGGAVPISRRRMFSS